MIASLAGHIQAIRKEALILQVGGVGYLVHVPRNLLDEATAGQQVHVGQRLELWVYTAVRENDLALYGFRTVEEYDLFALLLGVSGVGPRTALAVVSTFAPETLRGAVAQGNADALTRIPGIGRKTAQRLMLDLKDKIGLSAADWATPTMNPRDADVINALTALGYSIVEAQGALAAVPDAVESLDERILAALRSLGSQ
jgi:Holliday junction DNA helicase RuvA